MVRDITRRGPRAARFALAVAAAVVLPFACTHPVHADPVIASGRLLADATSANGSYVERVTVDDTRSLVLFVHSGSMNRTVPVQVQRPADTSRPRPVLYLLNGGGGGQDGDTWAARTDVLTFLADKNVNVVTPIGGAWSYYTDWQRPDPVLGVNKWKTFLTQELPPLVDAGLGTSGRNAIAGLSTSATAALALPIAAPGLYRSAASFSGCAQTSDPIGMRAVRLSVETWGGGNTDNMYGPPDDPMWAANDPYLHADQLRGVALYISTGTGLPGSHDQLDGPYALPGVSGLENQLVVGGVIEAATNYCTHILADRLSRLGIPARVNFRDTGTHSWGYWRDDLKDSWPTLAAPLAIPG
ncbi:alpha/beta hydrolase [Rhodococcus sp. NPDC127528]|uniref:alpha/beta hydrolase n=1 Tax=unclassified Rhodococcus (in: high G+C Gram-positive bacteria) TaxID=192944 RepID=UPI00362521EC